MSSSCSPNGGAERSRVFVSPVGQWRQAAEMLLQAQEILDESGAPLDVAARLEEVLHRLQQEADRFGPQND